MKPFVFRLLSPLALALLTGAASAQEIYMSGLKSPRNLFVDGDGSVFVAEAGNGGLTGGISVRKGAGAQTKYLDRLPSAAAPDGSDSVGPADIRRAPDGRLAVIFGLGADPAKRTSLGAGYEKLATLSLYDASTGTWQTTRDFAAREASEGAPDGEVNSNPFSFAPDGAGFAVADAGANAVWRDSGATFFAPQPVAPPGPGLPNPFPMDAVPTSIVARPGGGFMVGELGGFPFYKGLSRLYTLDAAGKIVDTRAGFTQIVDMAYAPDGSLLLTEFTTNGLRSGDPSGVVKRLRPDGTLETLISGLVTPTSLAFGQDGLLYITDNDLQLGGLVRRYAYQPVPEPATLAALGAGALAFLKRRKA